MLFLALLLQAAPQDVEDRRREPALPRILDIANRDCGPVGCARPPSRRYRLQVETAMPEDPQQRALRGAWQPCGITGAPVCPSRGRVVVRSDLD